MKDKLKFIILFALLQITYVSCIPQQQQQQQMAAPEQQETQFEENPNNEQKINPENMEVLGQQGEPVESNVPQPQAQPRSKTHHHHRQKSQQQQQQQQPQQQQQQQQQHKARKVIHAQNTAYPIPTPPTAVWKQKPLEPSIATVVDQKPEHAVGKSLYCLFGSSVCNWYCRRKNFSKGKCEWKWLKCTCVN